jgi:Mrp family chromosome partitioning ATPase
MDKIKNKILILSGKGGVGKSTLTTSLALTLVSEGYRVGVLDIDLTGPSLPLMFGLQEQKIHQNEDGWIPVYTDDTKSLGVVSLGFLLGSDREAVIWRGPKKNAMITQFVNEIYWGELDFLLIDTPPGTSDEHISIVGLLKAQLTGGILITTPQAISLIDVAREYSFCQKTGVPVLGLVENMSGFVCEFCSECTDLLSSGGGETFAKEKGIQFLGRLPIDPKLTSLIEGSAYPVKFKESILFGKYKEIIAQVLAFPSIAK